MAASSAEENKIERFMGNPLEVEGGDAGKKLHVM
jgi:hypothetical protein